MHMTRYFMEDYWKLYRYLSADEIKHSLPGFIQFHLRKRTIRHLQIIIQDTKKILNATEKLLILELQIITPIFTDTMHFPHSQ